MEEDDIRALVARLARPHSSGGEVIERAAILAEGADTAAILKWIQEHDGAPEELVAKASAGLHGTRLQDGAGADPRATLRYVFPSGALS